MSILWWFLGDVLSSNNRIISLLYYNIYYIMIVFLSKNENWNNVITRLLSYQLDSLLLLLNRIQGVSRIKMLQTTKKLNFSFPVYAGMEDHHMASTPGLYTSGRSTSSSSSPGVPGSSPALLVVPQPINATKMGGMQNGGVQPRKYQCKMCPQVRVSDLIFFYAYIHTS